MPTPPSATPQTTWHDPRAEHLRGLSWSRRWLYALKPASWPKLLVPMLLGQLAGFATSGSFHAAAFVAGALFSVLLLVFIVLLNDWSDAHVDRIKRQMFPSGCSPKTIPDGLLPKGALLLVGLLALGVGLAIAFFCAAALDRPWLGVSALVCASVFVAYSMPPLRLNYRGGGELLEALGVGVLLPSWNAYTQSGEALAPPLVDALPAFVCLSFASALASGLSDERSDALGGKRTFTTRFGNARVRAWVERCLVWAALAWVLMPLRAFLTPDAALGRALLPLLAGCVGASFSLRAYRALQAQDPPPETDAFVAQALYKGRLHGAIWYGSLAMMTVRAIGAVQ